MKQYVVGMFALVISVGAALPADASAHVRGQPDAGRITSDSALERVDPHTAGTVAEALAFHRDLVLSAPGSVELAGRAKPGPAQDKCSFNASRNLFRLRRTECRMA